MATEAIAEGREGVILHLRVTPRSRREEIIREGEEIRVRLTAPPANGRANRALVKLLARVLEVAPQDVEIISGAASRRKTIRVRRLGKHQVEGRLGRWLDG